LALLGLDQINGKRKQEREKKSFEEWNGQRGNGGQQTTTTTFLFTTSDKNVSTHSQLFSFEEGRKNIFKKEISPPLSWKKKEIRVPFTLTLPT
jgi:hypothetical protein